MMAIVVILAGSITAFLTSQKIKTSEVIIGDVDVDITVYFEVEDTPGHFITYTENLDYVAKVDEGNTFTKYGVTKIDISEPDDIKFIKNFRVKININSNVETYFRVAPYEQLTLVYTIGDGEDKIVKEVAVTQKKFMEFNYDPDDGFMDNRMYDGFYYYKSSVTRDFQNNKATEIAFIGEWDPLVTFRIYDPKYVLQIGFLVESVQAYMGPQIIWGMDTPPWGGEWN
jgi:hypothetical protein